MPPLLYGPPGVRARPVRVVALRAVAVTAAAVALAHLHLRWRPATLCPLRALTGIPCPLCGSTTALVHLGRLDVAGALRAAPVTLAVGAAVLAAPLGVARMWWRIPARLRTAVIVATLAGAEVWQLARFAVI